MTDKVVSSPKSVQLITNPESSAVSSTLTYYLATCRPSSQNAKMINENFLNRKHQTHQTVCFHDVF